MTEAITNLIFRLVDRVRQELSVPTSRTTTINACLINRHYQQYNVYYNTWLVVSINALGDRMYGLTLINGVRVALSGTDEVTLVPIRRYPPQRYGYKQGRKTQS